MKWRTKVLILAGILLFLAVFILLNLENSFCCPDEEVAHEFVNTALVIPLAKFEIDVGRYPTTEEGLIVLLSDEDFEISGWDGPYIEELPKDPWGRDYCYYYPAQKSEQPYDLYSFGPDKDQSFDDIRNWN